MRTFTQKQNQPQKQVSSNLTRSKTATLRPHHPEHPILRLHRAIGNQAVQRMLQTHAEELEVGLTGTASPRFGHDFSRVPVHPPAPGAIQTKLAINRPGDEYEQEADRVSESVMRMSEPQQQGPCACGGECPKCQAPAQEQELLQTKSVASRDVGETAAPPIVPEVLRSPGQRLDPMTRAFMEPRFGHDFAKVRVHTNSPAAQSAAAVNALAYTVGHHIVFGEGQHMPGSFRGQRLLAHELAHVVQQNGGRALHGELAGPPDISRAPDGLISRQPAPPPAQDPREERIAWHMKQLNRVADLLDKGRKLKPNPTKDFRDPDSLFRNTVELLDSGKMTLTILSPTHYAQDKHFDKRVKFDSQHKQPAKPDYPVNPRALDDGLVTEARTFGGTVLPPPSPSTTQTSPPKVERSPGRVEHRSGRPEPVPAKTEPVPAKTSGQPAAPPPFSPGDVYLFTHGIEITEGEFKNTFVHEGQHVADLSTQPIKKSADPKLEQYKSEFRAFWIEPPIPRTSAAGSATPFPEPTGPADNSTPVTIAKDQKCDVCPRPDPSVKAAQSAKTNLKNPRQEAIFRRIMSKYKDQQFDCCYVFNQNFRNEVDKFDLPKGLNLINSVRLLDLNLELQKLNKSMTLSQVSSTKFVVLLTQLESLDWVFLNDLELSQPFWDALKITAPVFLSNGVNALVRRGTKNPVSAADVNKALSGK